MRPLPSGADALNGRSSRVQDPNPALSPASTSNQLSCFITTESALENADPDEPVSPHHEGLWPRPKRSPDHKAQSSRSVRTAESSPAPAPPSPASLSSSVLDDDMLHNPFPPMTPVLAGLSGPESAISSASSRRNSLTASSYEGRESLAASLTSSPRPAPASQPNNILESPESQLIMPSVTVPPRRPFSDVGRATGKLKMMVAGPPGTATPASSLHEDNSRG